MKTKNCTLKKKLLKRLTHPQLLHFIWIRDEIEKKWEKKKEKKKIEIKEERGGNFIFFG